MFFEIWATCSRRSASLSRGISSGLRLVGRVRSIGGAERFLDRIRGLSSELLAAGLSCEELGRTGGFGAALLNTPVVVSGTLWTPLDELLSLLAWVWYSARADRWASVSVRGRAREEEGTGDVE